MLPKMLLHKRNGHRQGPDNRELTPGEIIRLVHSDRQAAPPATAELLKFAHIVQSERAGAADHQVTAVVARTQAAFDRGELADVRAALDALHAHADIAARMITQLVTSARRQRGGRRPDAERRLVNLNQVTRDTVETLSARVRPRVLDVRLDADLPWIVGNARQLRQAVASLIGYMADMLTASGRPGTIVVATVRRDSVVHGESVARIDVCGDGPAIPADVLPRMFQAFSGPLSAGKAKEMDLYLVARIVADHAGVVSARNLPEGSPCFTLEFPGI